MQGDTGVIDYLNQGLRHELTSVNQYLAALPPARELGLPDARQEMAPGVDRGNAARGQAH